MNWVALYALLKKKINDAIGLTNQFVDELPSTGDSGVLYFVPKDDPQDPDQYFMYVWDPDASDYVLLDPDMDLSIYAKSADLANVATSGSYTDLDNKPELKDLNDDSTHRTVSDAEKETWNAAAAGDYDSLINKPSVMRFQNDIFGTDTDPYVFRQFPSSASGAVRENLKKIIGASVVWNQLIDSGTTSVTIASGHKYILWNGSTLSLATSDGTAVSVSSGYKFYDITQMFGTSVANQMTTTKFAELFPDYASYAYSAPTIQSVSVSGHKVIGKNRFDKTATDTSKGYLNNYYLKNDGTTRSSNAWYISEYIRISSALSLSGLLTSDASNPSYGFYTIDKVFISGGAYNNRAKIENFTIPSNAYYVRVSVPKDNVDTIQIEFNSNATEYEPYTTQTTTLDHTTLRGIFKLDANNNLYADGDIYNADGSGSVKYGYIVFDGSVDENWTLQSINSYGIANFGIVGNNIKQNTDQSLCNMFIQQNSLISQTQDEGFLVAGSNTIYLRINSTTASTTTELRTWLSNNNLQIVFPLDTPTTATLTPFNPISAIENGGTEEFIDYGVEQGTRDVSVPCGQETEYYGDAKTGADVSMPTLYSGDSSKKFIPVFTSDGAVLSGHWEEMPEDGTDISY